MKLTSFLLLIGLLAGGCSANKVINVPAGNTVILNNGLTVTLINVANSRHNYDYLCNHVLFNEMLVLDKNFEEVTIGDSAVEGYIFNMHRECINDLLEKEILPTIPLVIPAPSSDSPSIPEHPTGNRFSEEEWSKPNIKSSQDVSNAYDFIMGVFEANGIRPMPHIPVLIVSRDEMFVQTGNRQTVGLASTTTYGDGEQAYTIRIISGLTRLDFTSVLAHEILHTWLNRNGIKLSSKHEVEGLCNYASYLILKSVDNDYAHALIKSMMENSDSVYGEGFRLMKKRIEAMGFSAFMDSLLE